MEKQAIGGRGVHKDLPERGRLSTPTQRSEDSFEEDNRRKSYLLMRRWHLLASRRPKTAKQTKLSTRPQYYNPDPVARMFGRANEAAVEVNGVPTTCLVDTGATVTIITAEFCDHLGLAVHSVNGLVTVSATGGANIPYLGYTVATIEFPSHSKLLRRSGDVSDQ